MQAIVLTIIAGASLNVVLLCHYNETVTKCFVATMQGECNAVIYNCIEQIEVTVRCYWFFFGTHIFFTNA